MSYKTILVYFWNDSQADSLLSAAAALASRHDSHVIGIYVAPSVEVFPVMGFPAPSSILVAQHELHDNEAKAVKAIFDKHGAGKTAGWQWRYVESKGPTVAEIVTSHAHCADLVLLAQPAGNHHYTESEIVFETLLMSSGRPLLLVPEGAGIENIGEHVAIAWNGTRESARAAFNAIAMLEGAGAKKATLIWLGAPAEYGRKSVPGSEMATSLARHGVNVETCSAPKSGNIGSELLNRARECGADVLVMGGYGHSRMREFVLGGATDHVLRHMKIPVLMSH